MSEQIKEPTRRDFLKTVLGATEMVVAGMTLNSLITNFAEACALGRAVNVELLPGVSVDINFSTAKEGDIFTSSGYSFKILNGNQIEVTDQKGNKEVYSAYAKNRCLGSDLYLKKK